MTETRSLRSPLACIALVLALVLGAPAPGAAQGVERIAAVVNDEVITTSDLRQRVQLALAASGLPDTPETHQRLVPQALRALIDERLQLQEAERLNISVSEQEIDAAFARLAEQNRMTPEQFEQVMAARGIPREPLREQLRATVAWGKVVQRELRPRVEIGPEEIDEALARIKANAGKPEYLVAEIFLAVDDPDQDEEVRRFAERLVDQIRQGANFPALARQFSQAAGAASGGDLGWVQQGQLPAELDQVLRQMQPGEISRPIRSVSGYHILLVRDRRTVLSGDPNEIRVALKQLLLPLPEGAGPDQVAALQREAEAVRQQVKSCADMDRAIAETEAPFSGDVGTVRLGDLPAELARLLATLPEQQPSPVITGPNDVRVLIVCERQEPPTTLPSREEIANALGQERLDMLQRRLMRDLRRAAFVDVRV